MGIAVNELDVAKLKPHTIMLLIGKRGTGKSVLLRDLLSHLAGRLHYGCAFSPTETSLKMFAEFLPKSCIYDQFDSKVLERMVEFQRAEERPKHQRSVFCIMDDCLYDKSVLRSKVIRQIFMNGRHHRITLILCAQYMMDLSPDLRGNVDYCFCLKDNAMGSRMKLWRNFFGLFDKYQEFSKVMDVTTQDHSAIVMDNTGDVNSVDVCVTWYRANPNPRRFFIGRRSYFRLALQHRVSGPRRRTLGADEVLMVDQPQQQRGGGGGAARRPAVPPPTSTTLGHARPAARARR